MSTIEAKGRAIGARRAAAVRDALAARLATLPGIAATVEGGAVVLAGRGLARRALTDPALRSVGR